MSSQAERIRVALSRTPAAAQPAGPGAGPVEETQATPPPITVSEENLAALLGHQTASIRPPSMTPLAEVESTLPLLAASDEQRLDLASEPASTEPEAIEP